MCQATSPLFWYEARSHTARTANALHCVLTLLPLCVLLGFCVCLQPNRFKFAYTLNSLIYYTKSSCILEGQWKEDGRGGW